MHGLYMEGARWDVETNSIADKNIWPRVSMMLAIGTSGELYSSLYQVNTDSKIFCLFLTKLAAKLGTIDPNWRENTVLLLDNAPYHRAKEVK